MGGQIVLALTWLVTTPFLVRFLGAETFGIYSLINAIVGSLAFADIGMGLASTRFGAAAYSRNDPTEEAAVVWTAGVLDAASILLAVISVVVAAPALLRWLAHLEAPSLHQSALGLDLAIVAFLFRSLANVLNTPQLVRLRIDVNTKVVAAINVTQMALIVGALIAGGRLVAVLAMTLATAIAGASAHLVVSSRLLPHLWPPRIRKTLARSMAAFGGPMVLSSIASVIFAQAEKLLLALFASPVVVAHYAVAFLVSTVFSLGSAAFATSLVSPFARLHAMNDRGEMQSLYGKVIRWTLIVALPFAASMIALARTFFTIWAGPEYGETSTRPFQILVIGAVINLITNVPYHLLVSAGETRLLAKFHLFEIPVHLVVTTLLTWRYAAVGAALGWTLRVAIDAILTFSGAARRTSAARLPLGRFLLATAILVVPAVVELAGGSLRWIVMSLASSLALYGWLALRFLVPRADDSGEAE